MSIPEKNDVDISKLFYWGGKFEIKNKDGKKGFTAYIRLVGDAELNRARVFALRSSAKLRAELKDVNSDMHMAYIPENYDDFSVDVLVELIATFKYPEINKNAFKSVDIPLPTEPDSDASIEEQEKYQSEIDDYPAKRLVLLKQFINTELDALKDELKKKSKEELASEYESSLMSNLCETEMINKFKEICTFYGCFKDKEYKQPMFESYEQFSNILSEIKEQLLDSYASLELSTDDLKK